MSESKPERTESGADGGQGTNIVEQHLFTAWCSQHQMHPDECFYIHYPHAAGGYTKCKHCGEWFEDIEQHVHETVSVEGNANSQDST